MGICHPLADWAKTFLVTIKHLLSSLSSSFQSKWTLYEAVGLVRFHVCVERLSVKKIEMGHADILRSL